MEDGKLMGYHVIAVEAGVICCSVERLFCIRCLRACSAFIYTCLLCNMGIYQETGCGIVPRLQPACAACLLLYNADGADPGLQKGRGTRYRWVFYSSTV